MTSEDLEHTIAAPSARRLALESLVATLAAHATGDRERALAAYDGAAQEAIDRCSGLPVGEVVLDLIEHSYAELRHLL
jgi:hypothetical protein